MRPTCKLCDQQKDLCDAHIIPDWAFNEIKEGHIVKIHGRNGKAQKIQTGIFDKSILCADCDGNKIGKYDTYAADFFRGDFSNLILSGVASSGRYVEYLDLVSYDFAQLKLFFISVLWRASITSRQEFKSVSLEPELENVAKQAVFNNDAALAKDFYISMSFYKPSQLAKDVEKNVFIFVPKRSADKVIGYSFALSGFEILISFEDPLPDRLTMSGRGVLIPLLDFDKSKRGKYLKEMFANQLII